MAQWHKLVTVDEISEGRILGQTAAGVPLILIRTPSGIRCFYDLCSHQDVRLSQFGMIRGNELVCNAHGGSFGMADGAPRCAPATKGLIAYETKVEDGWVYAFVPAE